MPLTVCLCSCGWFLLLVISLQYCWTLVIDGVCCSPPVLCILLAMLLKWCYTFNHWLLRASWVVLLVKSWFHSVNLRYTLDDVYIDIICILIMCRCTSYVMYVSFWPLSEVSSIWSQGEEWEWLSPMPTSFVYNKDDS